MRTSRIIKTIVGSLVIIAILVGMGFGISMLLNSKQAAIYFETKATDVVVEDIVGEKGDVVELPNPERTGYTFDGWYYDRQTQNLYGKGGDQVKLNSSKLQLFAKWSATKIRVTIIDENAVNPSDRTRQELVLYGSDFDLNLYSSQGEGVGYDYKWVRMDGEVGIDVNTNIPYIVTEAVTFKRIKYAKTYSLKYVYMDGVTEVVIDDSQTMKFNETFDFSSIDTTRLGYEFDRWELANQSVVNETTTLNASTYGVVSGTIVLYGIYNIKQFNVSFLTYDNVELNNFDIDYNSNISSTIFNSVEADATLNRQHYVFKGWMYDGVLIDKDDFVMPAENIELVAYYEKAKYEIKYYINVGVDKYFATQEIEYQGTLVGTIPSASEISNLIGENGDAYRLTSLTYNNNTYTVEQFESTFTSVEQNMTIKINLEKFRLFVHFVAGDGETIYESVLINKDEPIELPEEPGVEYAPPTESQNATFVFGGWLLDGEIFDGDYDFGALTQDLYVYSEWYEYNYADWSFALYNSMVTITGYNGLASKVCVPTQVQSGGIMVDVVRLGSAGTQATLTGVDGKKLLIKSNITIIGKYAFHNMKENTQVVFEDNSNNELVIEEYAFGSAVTGGNQYSIKSIKLPARTTAIDSLAFASAVSLVAIDVSGDCENYISKNGVLYETKSNKVILHTYPHAKTATSFVIPSNVTHIGNYAFYYHKGSNGTLSTLIEVSDSPESMLVEIGSGAFKDAYTLTDINFVNSNLISIGDEAFRNCFSSTTNNNGFRFKNASTISVVGANAFAGNVYVNNLALNLSNLTSLGEMAFHNTANLIAFSPTKLSVVLGGVVTIVPINAFADSNLTIEILQTNSIRSIGDNAFKGVKIVNAVFPAKVTLGSQCFNSANIDSIDFKDLPTLPTSTFTNATMSEIYIDGLTTMGESALRGSAYNNDGYIQGLQKVVLGNNSTLSYLSNFALRDNIQLTDLTLCNSLSNLGVYALAGCDALEEITIPNSVKVISAYCMKDCDSLTTVNMSNTIESIGGYAFADCIMLKNVMFPNGIISIADHAFVNTAIKSINVTCTQSIGLEAFANCINLVSATITVKVVESNIFYGCTALNSVSINFIGDNPDSIKLTGIFNGCTALETFILTGKVPRINNQDSVALLLFEGLGTGVIPRTIDICIPVGTKNLYLAIPEWQEYNLYLKEISINDNIAIDEAGQVLKVLDNVSSLTLTDVASINDYALYGLTNLSVLVLDTVNVITVNDIETLFASVDLSKLEIRVPNDLLNGYIGDSQWSSLASNFVGVTM